MIGFRSIRTMAGAALLAGLMALPAAVAGQQTTDEDTIGFYDDEFYDDEYYDDEYYDEAGEEGYFEDENGYFDEGGDEFYGEDDEYYGDDEFYDEGFEEGFEDEFLDDLDPGEMEDDLDLADDSGGEVELQEVEKRKIKKPRVIRGYLAKVAVASPWLAGLGFDSFWYSTIDARVALDLPRKAGAGALAPAYTLEVSTFSFENLHPAGGKFAGVALQGLMRIPVGPVEGSVGIGIFGSGSDFRGGMLFGTSYTIPFIRFIALTLESRLTYVQNATATGASYWLDVGGSIGYPF